MCGIAGYLNPQGVSQDEIERMVTVLDHRGPDDSGYYFAPGELNWAGDSPQHISYAFITFKAISNGEWPIWTNHLGAGSPYTQFYGFLFYLFQREKSPKTSAGNMSKMLDD